MGNVECELLKFLTGCNNSDKISSTHLGHFEVDADELIDAIAKRTKVARKVQSPHKRGLIKPSVIKRAVEYVIDMRRKKNER